ncbi:MAG: histidine phosphatase family protein [Clostridia bacterium]|nr:histidine phosphatase family protein [Clostridia bacterium]
MTTIYLIRHGQSAANAEHFFAGWTNVDLTGTGVLQARKTAEQLANVPFDAIYSSDLLRAYRTAEPHLDFHPLEIFKNDGLREFYTGDFEGVQNDILKEKFPDIFPDYWKNSFGNYSFPNGETVVSGAARFARTLTEIALAHDGQTVLVTSHAGVIRAFWGLYVLRLSPDEVASAIPFATNASYSVLTFTPDVSGGGEFSPVRYSEDAHLSDLATSLDFR